MYSYELPLNKACRRPMGWNIPNHPVLGALTLTPLSMVFIGIFCTYQGALNAMRALADKSVRYPLSIPFVE